MYNHVFNQNLNTSHNNIKIQDDGWMGLAFSNWQSINRLHKTHKPFSSSDESFASVIIIMDQLWALNEYDV